MSDRANRREEEGQTIEVVASGRAREIPWTHPTLARLGETTRALEVIAGVLQNGYLCAAAFDTDPWLIPLVSIPGGKDLQERARSLVHDAELAFARLGGRELLST